MKQLATYFGVALATVFVAVSPVYAQDLEKKVVVYGVIYKEQGNFLIKTAKEMGTEQVAEGITAICAAFGYDCSYEAAAITGFAKTAAMRTTEPGGEAHGFGLFAPKGYDVCRVKINYNNWAADDKSSISTQILDFDDAGDPNGPFYLAGEITVPKHRPEPHTAYIEFAVEFTPLFTGEPKGAGRTQNGCMPVHTHPIMCQANVGCRIDQSAIGSWPPLFPDFRGQ